MCIGHLISILFTMRSFYLSIYEVRRDKLSEINSFSQEEPLPSFKWTKSCNSTHGSIRAFVDYSNGPKPINAIGYRARTLNDKR